jgi:hypothetical protein
LSGEYGWPNRALYRAFYVYRAIYDDMWHARRGGSPCSPTDTFRRLCDTVARDALALIPGSQTDSRFVRTVTPLMSGKEALVDIPIAPVHVWIQSIASLLAILAHLAEHGGVLLNSRRTRRSIPTYPTHPEVVRSLVRAALRPLDSLATKRRSGSTLRILDPTIEGGQLLLGVACHFIDRAVGASSPGTKTSSTRSDLAGLQLIGFDQSPTAIVAARTAFQILEGRLGISLAGNVVLRQADALTWLLRTRTKYDVVVNNPPWGEPVRGAAAEILSHWKVSKSSLRDSAAAFVFAALRRLEEHGRYGFTLPSQLLTGQRGRELRALLSHETSLETIEWLPHSAFQPATVGAVSVSGTMLSRPEARLQKVEVRRPESTISRVPQAVLRDRVQGGWNMVAISHSASEPHDLRLVDVADAYRGVELYGVGRGRPPQTPRMKLERAFDSTTRVPGFVPVVRGRDVRPFSVGKPSLFIDWGPWLARSGRLAPGTDMRVYVRELCRRDGLLTAGVAQNGLLALHGVLTIICRNIDPYVLAAWLTSPFLATLTRATCAAFAKKDFQRITLAELKAIPIPAAMVGTNCPASTHRQLSLLARKYARTPTPALLSDIQQMIAASV